MDHMDIPIEPIRPPHVEVDPTLRTITRGVPDRAAIDAPIPKVRATPATQNPLNNFDRSAVTHVVIQVTITRQTQIFKYIGYQYDWYVPSVFWYFLGKIAGKALFDNQVELTGLNFVAIGRREFIAYTTSTWKAAADAQKAAGLTGRERFPPLNVIEVNFKKPQPGQPLEVTWAPARPITTAKIREWNEDDGRRPNHDTPQKSDADKATGYVTYPAQPS
ncbi:uncharacterized protein C8A04DRAFT_15565 [Dichotomopilus funicola]|uniref:Uncharacterized protein n=1 Tax=Dichotomopilus funicola TaxID=1934379 RepID=A0AAN6UV28_9PEZI|nr:hypothetical protein C8A04DRAFT_15565 [Dichotomopilus funicola]